MRRVFGRSAVSKYHSKMNFLNALADLAPVAEIASALATVVLAVWAIRQAKASQRQAQASEETVREMREARIAQERPQVIVEGDYSEPHRIYIVVRNIGGGAAKDIEFRFTADMVSSFSERNDKVPPLNQQALFAKGMPFLAPGAKVCLFWDDASQLFPVLREKGLEEGITVTSRYKSLAGEQYQSEWTINPLLIEDRYHVGGN